MVGHMEARKSGPYAQALMPKPLSASEVANAKSGPKPAKARRVRVLHAGQVFRPGFKENACHAPARR